MTVRLGPDHPCAYCGVGVYHRIETVVETLPSGTRHTFEIAHAYEIDIYRMHVCPGAAGQTRAMATLVRCPSCHLSVYQMGEQLYDDDAATGRHVCEVAAPEPTPAAAPPEAKPATQPRARTMAAPSSSREAKPIVGITIPTL